MSGGAVLYLFSTALHTGVLGALLTLAPTSWYPSYRFSTRPFGLSALEDQQLGGLIMWVPAGLVFLAAALWLLARLLQARPSSLHWRYGGDGTPPPERREVRAPLEWQPMAKLAEAGVAVRYEPERRDPLPTISSLLGIATILAFGLAWALKMRDMTRSGRRFLPPGANKGFADVAGQEEAKAELGDIVSYLRDPSRFTAVGAAPCRGILLYGPPGNGKTRMAAALAGEAGVPFLHASGSEFTEMFVGLGAMRVRRLFDDAADGGTVKGQKLFAFDNSSNEMGILAHRLAVAHKFVVKVRRHLEQIQEVLVSLCQEVIDLTFAQQNYLNVQCNRLWFE